MIPGVDRLHHVVTQAKALHHSRSKVLDDDVCIRGELEKDLLGLVLLEVKGEAALVAIDGHEIGALALNERRAPVAGVVAAARNLDLDDVRPVVAQHQGAERAGQGAGQIQHFQAFQCLHSCLSPEPNDRNSTATPGCDLNCICGGERTTRLHSSFVAF